eukprot:Gb_30288 [translate_table: standard]
MQMPYDTNAKVLSQFSCPTFLTKGHSLQLQLLMSC